MVHNAVNYFTQLIEIVKIKLRFDLQSLQSLLDLAVKKNLKKLTLDPPLFLGFFRFWLFVRDLCDEGTGEDPIGCGGS